MLIPPLNFSLVVGEFYRSGHPIEINYPFLEQLGLRTIVYLGDRSDEDNKHYRMWCKKHGIRYVSFDMNSVKEPFEMNNPEPIRACLELLVDRGNYPVLVHSNKGKHRVGVLAGIYRKQVLGWSLAAVYEEYIRFARGKAEADLAFIELFPTDLEVDLARAPLWMADRLVQQQSLAASGHQP